MRVRFRLHEQRVAEMLRGIDPESLGANFVTVTAGLLGCIGDIASLKFLPVFEGAQCEYAVLGLLTSACA